MDAQLKAKWVEALRSGKYRQARSALIDNHPMGKAFCCLGVLCDVLGTQWDGEDEQGLLNGVEVRNPSGSYLSKPILNLVKLDDPTQKILATKNDGGQSFTKIADYIEANL